MYEHKRYTSATLHRQINVGCTEELEAERNSIITSIYVVMRINEISRTRHRGLRSCDGTNPRCFHNANT